MFPSLTMMIYISDLLYLFSDMVWILRSRSIEKTPEDEWWDLKTADIQTFFETTSMIEKSLNFIPLQRRTGQTN